MEEIRVDSNPETVRACVELARSLDAGFTETAVERMARTLPDQQVFVAEREGDIVGFAAVSDQSTHVAELAWFAVREADQGQGIGTRLLQAVVDERVATGDRLLTVKTLAATAEDSNYERTREFYKKEGFLHVDTIDPYPGWDPGNPCAIYVKPLG